MDPELLLQAVYTVLHRDPPAGLDADDVDRFFERNRAGLLQAVRQAFPVAAIEPAFTRLREEHRLARLVFDATERHLAARGLASQGAELADFIDALDDHVIYENRTLFPYLRGQLPSLAASIDHAREEHEDIGEHLFALAAALRAGRPYEGPALEAARHHFAEEEEQLVAPALAAGLARTPAGQPGRLLAFAADIERLAAPVPQDEPTRQGGRRGAEIPPAELVQGQRVVTERGEHGVVTEIHRITFTSVFGGRRDDRDVHHAIQLRLDSGREAIPTGALYEERAAPTAVVPDIEVGARWLAPAEVWSQVLGRLRDVSSYAEKAENARKPEMKRRWQQHRAEARQDLLELVRVLAAWREAHPGEPVEGLDERRWRLVTLEAKEPRTEDESWELAWLRRVPPDWSTRFRVGDPVVIHVLGPYGRQPDPGWTVAEIRGHEAILSRGEVARAEPLWMLKADDRAPLVETFTEPRYLRELAQEMLVQTGGQVPYPTRGAVARAVKTFLGEQGLTVSTHVLPGSMVTLIDLQPATGRWSAAEQARLRALLPALRVASERQASFEPWETEGEPADPHAYLPGRRPGLSIPVEHLPRFAAILAGALKAEGQTLNTLGERRLAAALQPGVVLGSGARGGATDLQRASASEGCRELDFELPGYGRVRVACAQEGRRDTWFNIWIGPERYGFNGGRWARNQRPPEPVLSSIRERGVTSFS